MSLAEFYWATDREVFNWIQGHRQLQWEQSEDNWNRTRHEMYASNLVYMKKEHRMSPSDFIPLYMDGEPKQIDPYDAQAIRDWSEKMDSIPFSDPREYFYNTDI